MTETQENVSVSAPEMAESQRLVNWAVLPNRRCYIADREEFGTIVEMRGGDYAVRTAAGVETVAADRVSPLPEPGERVVLRRGRQVVTGVWLGVVDAGEIAVFTRPVVSVWKPTAADLQDMAVWPFSGPAGASEALPPGDAAGDVAALARRLLNAQQTIGMIRKENREDLERLVADAHQWADEYELCERFDDFLVEHGLPGRTKPHEVDVVVRLRFTLTVDAVDQDAAEASVTSEQVFARLEDRGVPRQDVTGWDVL